MIELKKYKFSDLYDMSSGITSTKEQAGHGQPFVSFSTVFNNYILPDELPDLMDTSEREQKIYSIKKGDILITRTSETLDELAMSSVALKDYPKATYSGFVKRLRPKQKHITYDKFMAFYLRSPYFRKIIQNNTNMTLRASFNEDIFSYITILLPPFDMQRHIGDAIYLLEKKISINRKLSDKLEKQVQMLFDYWFVQFQYPIKYDRRELIWDKQLQREIPIDWEVVEFQNLCRVRRGASPRPIDEYMDESGKGIPWIKISDASNAETPYLIYIKEHIIPDGKAKSVFVMPDTLIVSNSATPGIPKFVEIDACVHDGWLIIDEYEENLRYYLYYIIKMVRKTLLNIASGSVFKNLKTDYLKEFKCIKPSDKVLDAFYEKVHPIMKKILINEKEIIELKKLRDTIFPLLMNGQVVLGNDLEE
jgi:Restriction endonuclease S subunits